MWRVNRADKPSKYYPSTALVILVGCAWVSFRAGRLFQELFIAENLRLQQSRSRRAAGVSTSNNGGSPTRNGTWLENNGRHCTADIEGTTTCSVPEAASVLKGGGFQLLVDITNVDAEFLNSEKRLAQAMVELIERADNVEMLSYHCHELAPAGVGCVGLLSPGTVTLHTWPAEGMLSMSIYLTTKTLSALESVRSLFGIPSAKAGGYAPEPHMVWAQKYRGFTEESSGADLPWQLGTMDDKHELVANVETPFHIMDILDLTTRRFGGDDAASGKQQDRVVYLDGVLESRRFGDSAYHETLVHPALFAHDDPHRVVIVGRGEGATLREVLKHKTVEEVIMVEIDELMVTTSRQYMPEWSDCSNLEGSTLSCFGDPRVKIFFEDAIVWFTDRLGGDRPVGKEDLVDIIILDTVNLEINASLASLFSETLGDSGILIIQLGMDYNLLAANPLLVEYLAEAGFQSIVSFEGSGGRFGGPWGFAVAMKDWDTRSNWFRSSAEVDLQIHQRTLRTTKSALPFRFFDGASMMKYQAPSRQLENFWCQLYPRNCEGGHGYDPELTNVPVSAFEVKPSVVANGGRGVFAKQFIPKGSVVAMDDCVHEMHVHSTTFELMEGMEARFGNVSDFWSAVFDGYLDGYGWTGDEYGKIDCGVDPGIMTFANHGCNGKYNVGEKLEETELTFDFGRGLTELYGTEAEEEYSKVFNPFSERHFPSEGCAEFLSLRDIDAGEELLDNYIVFGGPDVEFFESNLSELKQLCSGGVGKVSEYEEQSKLKGDGAATVL